MELTGEHRIPAPRQRVWEALHDTEILKACITGCQELEMADDGSMKAKVTAKVGPVKATFNADVEIVNSEPPHSYTLKGEGKGGVAGFAKGAADVSLAEDGEETILTYDAKAQVGGKLAQLGSRLVDSTAKRYAADFFTKFSEIVGGGAPATGPEAGAPAEPAPTPEPDAAEPAASTEPVVPPEAVVAPQRAPAAPPPAANEPAPAPAEGNKTWLWVGLGAVVLAIIIFALT
ncbi:MAG: hypothetical protein AcusKO_40860 [Acuticoccus sp.]